MSGRSSARFPERLQVGALGAACVAVFLAGCALIWDFTVDDAFISFRYAAHLAAGHGLVWNPGDAPLEGFTNLLYTVALAAPALLGLDLVVVAKLAGVLATLVTALVVAVALRRWTGSLAAATLAGLLICADPRIVTHAVAGLETPLYMMMVTLVALTTAACLLRPASSVPALPLGLSFVTALLRPEGAALGLLVVALLVLLADRATRTATLKVAVPFFLLPLALFFVWKSRYFGELVPNTVLVKSSSSLIEPRTVKQIVYFYLWWVLPLLALSGLALRRSRELRRPLLAVLAIATALVLGYLPTKLIMGYKFRFFAPVFPLLVFAAGVGLARLQAERGTRRGRWVFAAAAACFLLYPIKDAPDTIEDALAYAAGLNHAHVRIGKSLADWQEGGLVFVSSDAGAVPYYSGWRTIDGAGLNDAHLARQPETVADYALSQQPDVLVLTSDQRDGLRHAITDQIVADPRFGEYQKVASLDFLTYERRIPNLSYREIPPDQGYWEQVWVHRSIDAPRVERLRAQLSDAR